MAFYGARFIRPKQIIVMIKSIGIAWSTLFVIYFANFTTLLQKNDYPHAKACG